MSVNGEITAVHISRKSSSHNDTAELDRKENFEGRTRFEERAARPRSSRYDRPFMRETSSNKDEHILRPDSDQIDLEKLLHSVLDINEYGNRHKQTNISLSKKQRPFSAHQISSKTYKDPTYSINGDETRSFISEGKSPRVKPHRPASAQVVNDNRTNYSFSNETVGKIDRENQRLLREIMRNQAKKSSSRQVVSKKLEPVRVKSAATLNRSRFQSQVERENLAFLKRLDKVKPTKELSRDHLLKEHFRQEQLSSNISRSKRPPSATQRSKRSSSLSDLSQIDRESVLSSRASVGSSKKAGLTNRPISAKSLSRTRQVLDSRPMWEAGW